MKKYLLLIIWWSSLFSDNKEKIFYNAKFRNINVGSAVLETYNFNLHREINFSLKTRKFIDVIYKLRDDINLKIDAEDYSILKFNKKSSQGSYKLIDQVEFDYLKNIAINKKESWEIKNKIYDPLSIIAYLRNTNLSINKKFTFDIYNNGKIKNIILNVVGDEIIKIKNNLYDCFIIEHESLEKSEIKIWISKSAPYLPILIHTINKNGKIILQYKSHKK